MDTVASAVSILVERMEASGVEVDEKGVVHGEVEIEVRLKTEGGSWLLEAGLDYLIVDCGDDWIIPVSQIARMRLIKSRAPHRR